MVETFWQDSPNCISLVQRSMFPEEFSFWASLISCKIRSWCKVFLIVVRKLFNSPIKIAIYVSRETFWRGKIFSGRKSFFFVWGLWPRKFRNLRQNNFVSFVENCIQLIQRNDLMKILSFKNLELLYQFRTLNKKSPDFLLENFCTVFETVLACPGYIWGKKLVEHCAVFFVFEFWLTNLHLRRSFFGCVVKIALFCASGSIWEIYCLWKILSGLNKFRTSM